MQNKNNLMGIPLFKTKHLDAGKPRIMYATSDFSDVYHYMFLSGDNGKWDKAACNNSMACKSQNGAYGHSHWQKPPNYILSPDRPKNKRPCIHCLYGMYKTDNADSTDSGINRNVILTADEYRSERGKPAENTNRFRQCFLLISCRQGLNRRDLIRLAGLTGDSIDRVVEFLLDLGAIVCIKRKKRGLVFYAAEEINIVLELLSELQT